VALRNIPDIENIAFLPADSYVVYRVLGASTAETFAIPDNAKYVEISTTVLTYITGTVAGAADNVATVPVADVTDGTGPEIITTAYPYRRSLSGLSKLSIISAGTPNVSLTFFRA
jgi:hypothetical protein